MTASYQIPLVAPAVSNVAKRDYQIEAIERIEWWLREQGTRRLLTEMATGTGKTSVMVWLAEHLNLYPVLGLVDRIELAEQMSRRFEELCPGLRVGVEQADREAPLDCDVVVASVPTLSRKSLERAKRWAPNHFALVFDDEAHRSYAPGRLSVLRYFKPELLCGFTATSRRADGKPLADIYDEVAFELGLEEAIERDILCRFRAHRIRTQEDLSQLEVRGFDFRPEDVSAVVNTDWRNSAVISGIEEHAADRRAIVIRCANKAHVERLDEQLRANGHNSSHILEHTTPGERATRLDRFAKGDIRIMCHCDTLTYGVDIPRIDCIVWAAPTKSPVAYIQQTGRGFRKHPGKTDLLVLDFVGVCGKHEIMTASRIFGERDVDLLGEDVVLAAKKIKAAEQASIRIEDGESLAEILKDLERVETIASGTARVTTIAESVELFHSMSERVDEDRPSLFPWMKTGEGSYGLRCGRSYFWLMADKLGRWSVWEGGPKTGKKHGIEGAFTKPPYSEANKIIKRQRPDWRRYRASAAWHNERATAEQIKRLVEMGIEYMDLSTLTKGAASRMINGLNMMKYIKEKGVPG